MARATLHTPNRSYLCYCPLCPRVHFSTPNRSYLCYCPLCSRGHFSTPNRSYPYCFVCCRPRRCSIFARPRGGGPYGALNLSKKCDSVIGKWPRSGKPSKPFLQVWLWCVVSKPASRRLLSRRLASEARDVVAWLKLWCARRLRDTRVRDTGGRAQTSRV